MIISKNWVWLHFPKCAGTFIENAIRQNFSPFETKFDKIDPEGEIIWHHNLDQRRIYDPSFTYEGKRVICAIRRLPTWLLSRVHFEASRPPFLTTPRNLLESGSFFENTGYTNKADDLLASFNPEKITDWLRQEALETDLKRVFNSNFQVSKKRRNETKIEYLKELQFWFTPKQLANLYAQNPLWAELEKGLYGSIIEL